jgi:hypothetical protein
MGIIVCIEKEMAQIFVGLCFAIAIPIPTIKLIIKNYTSYEVYVIINFFGFSLNLFEVLLTNNSQSNCRRNIYLLIRDAVTFSGT